MTEPEKRPAALSPADPRAALARLRAEIDRADRAILAALNERARLVERVAELKRASETSVYAAARERDLVEALVGENPGPFPSEALRHVFREIISATRSLEAALRVGFLGPEGTFSHLAARQTFGARCSYVPLLSIAEVFAAVERGVVDLGVVPLENTTEGVVTQTLDAFVESDLSICGETLLRISHYLMSRSGRLSEVKRVASHPQPLAQCRRWLESHLPGVERVETASTAGAARLAAEHPEVAAVGPELLAELAGLRVIASAIEDRRDNTTRFLLIGGDPPAPSGNDLTAVVFSVRSEAGTLHRLLEPFARHGVNLTSIQSRPLEGTAWEYRFFIDVEGHRDEPRVALALQEAARCASFHRVLGSFPRAAQAVPRAGGS